MISIVITVVEHDKPIPHLSNMVAGRTYTIDGVNSAQPGTFAAMATDELDKNGFTLRELSLGAGEVVSL